MHLVDGQAALCMASVHGIGARCWLGGRGRGLLAEPVTSFMVGCYMKWISAEY